MFENFPDSHAIKVANFYSWFYSFGFSFSSS